MIIIFFILNLSIAHDKNQNPNQQDPKEWLETPFEEFNERTWLVYESMENCDGYHTIYGCGETQEEAVKNANMKDMVFKYNPLKYALFSEDEAAKYHLALDNYFWSREVISVDQAYKVESCKRFLKPKQ